MLKKYKIKKQVQWQNPPSFQASSDSPLGFLPNYQFSFWPDAQIRRLAAREMFRAFDGLFEGEDGDEDYAPQSSRTRRVINPRARGEREAFRPAQGMRVRGRPIARSSESRAIPRFAASSARSLQSGLDVLVSTATLLQNCFLQTALSSAPPPPSVKATEATHDLRRQRMRRTTRTVPFPFSTSQKTPTKIPRSFQEDSRTPGIFLNTSLLIPPVGTSASRRVFLKHRN